MQPADHPLLASAPIGGDLAPVLLDDGIRSGRGDDGHSGAHPHEDVGAVFHGERQNPLR